MEFTIGKRFFYCCCLPEPPSPTNRRTGGGGNQPKIDPHIHLVLKVTSSIGQIFPALLAKNLYTSIFSCPLLAHHEPLYCLTVCQHLSKLFHVLSVSFNWKQTNRGLVVMTFYLVPCTWRNIDLLQRNSVGFTEEFTKTWGKHSLFVVASFVRCFPPPPVSKCIPVFPPEVSLGKQG